MSSKLRVRKMPLPWESASGLTMKVLAFLPLNCYLNSLSSAGSSQVGGKKEYSCGWYLDIFMRFLPRCFLFANAYIPGVLFFNSRNTGKMVCALVRVHSN